MSHLPLSLMNRLSKPESAVQILDAVFPKDPFYRLFSQFLHMVGTLIEEKYKSKNNTCGG